MQIKHFVLDKILKLSTYYAPFYHQSLQSYLIKKKTVKFFWPTLYYRISITSHNSESWYGWQYVCVNKPEEVLLTCLVVWTTILAYASVLTGVCMLFR